MLTPETPYPYVGSYALYVDPDARAARAAELARIIARREGFSVVAFPLRNGASGNKEVPAAELIDATPLSTAETREFHELERHLRGRTRLTPKQKREAARRDALKSRVIYAPILVSLLLEAALRKAA